MNIQELIEYYCQNNIEFTSIGHLIKRVREKGKSYPNIKTVYAVSNTKGLVNAEEFRDHTIHSENTSNYTVVKEGMFAYNPARLNIGSIGYLKTDISGLVSPMYVVFNIDENKITKEYLFTFIKSKYCSNKIESLTENGARFRFEFERWSLIPIPIPPLPVQKEIVRILETFTELTAELTAELAARKKQYNFYREQLLSFNTSKDILTTKGTKDTKDVVWKMLGEVLVRTKGTSITAGQMKKMHKDGAPLKIFAGGKTIAFFDYEDIPSKDINREPSIIVKSRGIIEFEYYDKDFSHKNEMWSYHSKDKNVNIKYVYYFLKIHEPYFKNIASRMQMPQISIPDTDKFIIPVPSIEEQARIVSILDSFDTLTTSISEGLPKEIELRKKQYEYYRDRLLTF